MTRSEEVNDCCCDLPNVTGALGQLGARQLFHGGGLAADGGADRGGRGLAAADRFDRGDDERRIGGDEAGHLDDRRVVLAPARPQAARQLHALRGDRGERGRDFLRSSADLGVVVGHPEHARGLAR
jgi:hypothetical protein